MFNPVEAKPDFPAQEKKIIKFWEQERIFQKSVEQRPADQPYRFYDGPPFVTGYPHYGGLLVSVAKDVIPRFQTMKGKRVRRVWGWDCHGLPIENKVEEKLGLRNRREIEEIGINNFINECRSYVNEVSSEWDWYIDRIGRWVDMESAYRTMDLDYMESVIWVFKQLYDRGLIYQGVRTSLYCTRCGTPVSRFEIAMDDSYDEMEDPAITVEFPLKDGPFAGASLLAWTTTPWTLPSNRALVIDPEEVYALVSEKTAGRQLILAQQRVEEVMGDRSYRTVERFPGKRLLGLEYRPPFSFYPGGENDFKVYAYEEMVNMEEGTGVVHSAPGFGDIDTVMGQEKGLTIMFAVDDEGKFVPAVTDWAGKYVKDADPLIIEHLRKRDLLFQEDRVVHRYPYCYRCETPLIHRAQHSWFVDIQSLKEDMLAYNEAINWVPSHFKHGRFENVIKQAPDWCISRTRYWATIMPVWECQQCDKRVVVGSIAEIERRGGHKVTDLHRTGVDDITFDCPQCQGVMRRIPEVLDVWMDSGSMPYAERHYPFENVDEFEKSFPADYVVEYTGQIRAWFNVMHRISTALMDSHCFENVVVTGVMAGTDGRKMSKSYGNYPDPKEVLTSYGGDALRLYLMSSPVMLGQNVQMTEGEEIEEQIKKVLLILWNSYRYFLTYYNLHQVNPETLRAFDPDRDDLPVIDRWLISELHEFLQKTDSYLTEYQIPAATNLIQPFVNRLSTWYIRRSRHRFVNGELNALQTFYYVLKVFLQATAPIIPFITESIYQNIRFEDDPESVHLCYYPHSRSRLIDRQLSQEMLLVEEIVEKGHAERRREGVKVRQPLPKLTVFYQGGESISEQLIRLLRDELNVKEVTFVPGEAEVAVELDFDLDEDLIREGIAREIRRRLQSMRGNVGYQRDSLVNVGWQTDSERIAEALEEFSSYLKDEVMIEQFERGNLSQSDLVKSYQVKGDTVTLSICRNDGEQLSRSSRE